MSDLTFNAGMPGGPMADPRLGALARNWWAVALRGVVAIIFGLFALFSPVATLASLVFVFGIYMLVDGVFAIVAGVRAAAHHERWGPLIGEGALDLLAAAGALLAPGLAVIYFVYLAGFWAVASGVALLMATFRLHAAHGRVLMGLAAVVSIVWGVLLVLSPLLGAVVMTTWLGIYALVFGAALLALSFRLRASAPRA